MSLNENLSKQIEKLNEKILFYEKQVNEYQKANTNLHEQNTLLIKKLDKSE